MTPTYEAEAPRSLAYGATIGNWINKSKNATKMIILEEIMFLSCDLINTLSANPI